jgi:hypothetical protein
MRHLVVQLIRYFTSVWYKNKIILIISYVHVLAETFDAIYDTWTPLCFYFLISNSMLCSYFLFSSQVHHLFICQIEIKTAPADFRFPTTNQTRHCFTRYIEYHRYNPIKFKRLSFS